MIGKLFRILSLILPKNSPILKPEPAGLISSGSFFASRKALSTSSPIEIPVPIPGNNVAIPDATSIKPPTISPDLNLLIANPHDMREPIPGILFNSGFKILPNNLPIVPKSPLAPPLPAILVNGFNKNLVIPPRNPFAFLITLANKFLGIILANRPVNLANCLPAIFWKSLTPPIIPPLDNIFKRPFKGPSDIIPVTRAARPPSTSNAGPMSFLRNPIPPLPGSLSSDPFDSSLRSIFRSFSAFLPKSVTITGFAFSTTCLGADIGLIASTF